MLICAYADSADIKTHKTNAAFFDAGGVVFETVVVEREAKILTILPGLVLEPDSSDLHLEVAVDGSVRCHGTGRHRVIVHRPGGADSSLPFDAEAFASSVGILAPPPP